MEALPERPSDGDCCGSGCSPCVFEVYEKLLENFRTGAATCPVESSIRHDLLSPLKYKPFVLVSVEEVNRNSNIYDFKPLPKENLEEGVSPVEISGILPYKPGQHVIFTNSVEKIGNSVAISRAYTPISVAGQQKDCLLRLLIKIYENGAMSAFISRLSVNDVVLVRGPFGDFSHVPDSKYLMLCAGTGLAPMVPIIETILSDDCDESVVRLCFACATLEEVYCREKIRQFSRYWNFEAHIYLSKESGDRISRESAHNENMYSQKITLDVVRARRFSEKHRVLVCGSNSFNEDMKGFIESCGGDDVFVF